jgi:hypothetical protein
MRSVNERSNVASAVYNAVSGAIAIGSVLSPVCVTRSVDVRSASANGQRTQRDECRVVYLRYKRTHTPRVERAPLE